MTCAECTFKTCIEASAMTDQLGATNVIPFKRPARTADQAQSSNRSEAIAAIVARIQELMVEQREANPETSASKRASVEINDLRVTTSLGPNGLYFSVFDMAKPNGLLNGEISGFINPAFVPDERGKYLGGKVYVLDPWLRGDWERRLFGVAS
jgi:hypothetical protein